MDPSRKYGGNKGGTVGDRKGETKKKKKKFLFSVGRGREGTRTITQRTGGWKKWS